jgi:transposase InsO family protein
MNKAAKEEIDTCLPCQVNESPNPPEPLLTPAEMPDGPWQFIHAYFYGPLPTGQYIIVLIAKYSRYPVSTDRNNYSTSAKTLIPKLDAIFPGRGIPHTFKSDNGPPFNGNEFKTYLTKLDVTHEISRPEWPQGNSVAEAFMKPLGKAIRTARAENRNWVQELSRFSTNIPPAQLLFNRPVRGTLPMLNPKTKGRDYANERRHTKSSSWGQFKVILKQRKRNKFTAKFEAEPYTAIERKGT